MQKLRCNNIQKETSTGETSQLEKTISQNPRISVIAQIKSDHPDRVFCNNLR